MGDDIVTHLRAVAADSVYRAEISVSKLDEAADEIERLRAFADHLAQAADIDRVRLMSRIIALETGAINE